MTHAECERAGVIESLECAKDIGNKGTSGKNKSEKRKEMKCPVKVVALIDLGRQNVIEYMEDQSADGIYFAKCFTYWCSRPVFWK